MDHVMFENEAGEAECVACGRRIQWRGGLKVVAKGDVAVSHAFSSFPGLSFSINVE